MEHFDFQPSLKKIHNDVVILVEGVSDIAFLNLYICNRYGFHFVNIYNLEEIDKRMSGNVYQSNNSSQRLYLFSTDGKDRMQKAFENIKPLIFNQNIGYFIVIVDSDQDDPNELTDILAFEQLKLLPNQWIPYQSNKGFEDVNLQIYLRVIPEGKCGALETVLLDSMRQDEPDIVNISIQFVDSLNNDQNKYIKSPRLKLKAKTGVVFNLLAPDKTFDSLTKKFKLINLEADSIQENFSFLDQVFGKGK